MGGKIPITKQSLKAVHESPLTNIQNRQVKTEHLVIS